MMRADAAVTRAGGDPSPTTLEVRVPAPDPTRILPAVYGPNHGRAQGHPVSFLKPLVQSPFTEVGDYTYYADPDDPTGFEINNVLFHYGPDRLVLGRYCGLARGVRFIMGAATHRMSGVSTFPFPMFGADWMPAMDLFAERSLHGDTVVGSDVWLGYQTVVLPGVRIGDGAIVGAMSVVTSDVPPYSVVGGNPARLIRRRFGAEDVERLLRIAWWDWPAELVTRHLRTIMSEDVDELEAVARKEGMLGE
jgi:virginiamycin A acetyltransferase